jgi:hypothetical protein
MTEVESPEAALDYLGALRRTTNSPRLLAAIESVENELVRDRELTAAREEVAALKRELELARAHDAQPYPTAEAYEKVAAALHHYHGKVMRVRAKLDQLSRMGSAANIVSVNTIKGVLDEDGDVPVGAEPTRLELLAAIRDLLGENAHNIGGRMRGRLHELVERDERGLTGAAEASSTRVPAGGRHGGHPQWGAGCYG